MPMPTSPAKKPLRVVELFAGVGGFHIGLAGAPGSKAERPFKVVWSNQWEPSTKRQHASETYVARFGHAGHSNEDIATVPTDSIPDHDLLCGGFPCQDYSVARNLSQAHGLNGKKGVLWWQIHRILKEKGEKAPRYLMLENVDRLLKSPATQRGRDFAIMLASLCDLGYAVEWRVVNAADYGMPQRRRRVFMLAYKDGCPLHKRITKAKDLSAWIKEDGVIAKAFPMQVDGAVKTFELRGDLATITKEFSKGNSRTMPFATAGACVNRNVTTCAAKAVHEGPRINLGDVLVDEKEVPQEYFIKKADLPRWKYLKGGKKEERKGKDGFTFFYGEGPMAFPDPIDKPSRTIITAEGGSTPSRFKHVVKTESGKLRRLMPLELERLCMFPDNHTAGQADARRAFFMGNALVVGVIQRLGESLIAAAR